MKRKRLLGQREEGFGRYIVIKTVKENTMYSPKITIFSDKDAKIKTFKENKIIKGEKTATVEEIDKSIDALVAEEVLEK